MDFQEIIFILLFLAMFAIYESVEEPNVGFKKRRNDMCSFLKIKNNLYEYEQIHLSVNCIAISGEMKMEIRGSIVKLSEIVRNLTCQSQPVHFLEIFTLEKVIIDEDLIKVGEAFQVAIISPIWEIIGDRIINLNGTHGEILREPKTKINHVNNGHVSVIKDGSDGQPGQPGGPAGSFYGIGKQFINGQNLKITAHGGDGSAGQDGGDGADGKKGRTYHFETLRAPPDGILGLRFDEDGVKSGYKYFYELHELSEEPDYVKRINYTKPISVSCYRNSNCDMCHVYGLSGKEGGNGGNGGAGGKGGKKGEIKIFYLEQNGLINWSAEDGQDGKDGIGGKRGIGGYNGDMVEVDCSSIQITYFFSRKYREQKYFDIVPSKIKQKDGENGKTGVNILGQKRWKEADIIQDFPHILKNYKTYLTYICEKLNRSMNLELLNLINNNTEISGSYTILDLIDEFTKLELEFYELKDSLDLTKDYKFILRKLRAIRRNSKQGKKNAIIIDLSNKIETILHKISEGDDYYVVPYIREFITELESQIKYITDLHSVNEEKEVFNNYKKGIDILIENAQDKIDTVIEKRLKKLMTQSFTEEKLLDKDNKSTRQLHNLEDNVCLILIRMLNTMKKSITIKNNNLGRKSVADENIERWEIYRKLSSLLNELTDFQKEFSLNTLDTTDNTINNTINNLKEAINAVVEIYQKMKEYSEINIESKLALDLMKGLSVTSTTDNTLEYALSKMEEVYQLNIAISKYNRLLIAFQQYIFPKSVNFLHSLVDISYSSIGENLKNIQMSIAANVRKIKEKMFNSWRRTFVVKREEKYFDGSNDSEPFFVWKKEQHGEEINKILKGEEVVLYADINEHPELNGVRFNKIELNFTSKNPEIQKKLMDVMKEFSFSLIHEGDSHYRCGDYIFLGTNNPTRMIYSFREELEESEGMISTFTKNIFEGEFVLSPYATWKVKIIKLSGQSSGFGVLDEFVNQVDLELVGRGVNVDNVQKSVCKKLKSFYEKKSCCGEKSFMAVL